VFSDNWCLGDESAVTLLLLLVFGKQKKVWDEVSLKLESFSLEFVMKKKTSIALTNFCSV